MPTMSAARARESLYPLLAQVNEDRDVVRITSRRGNGVLMSEADYEAIQTTNHLFSSAANSRILMRSFAESDAGNVVIEDPDAFLDGE